MLPINAARLTAPNIDSSTTAQGLINMISFGKNPSVENEERLINTDCLKPAKFNNEIFQWEISNK